MHDSPEELQNRELAQARLSHEGKKYFKYIEFDSKEQLVTEIRKHPFGLFLILLTGAFIMLALLAASYLLSDLDFGGFLNSDSLNNFRPLLILLCFALILGVAIATFIGAFLYVSNVIFLTSEKIAQVLYISLFNRKISQLSIGDVQDVTVTQKGILAHFFNYGTLIIETAGEQQNYLFTFVPNPYQNSKLIVGAHEANLALHGN